MNNRTLVLALIVLALTVLGMNSLFIVTVQRAILSKLGR